MDEKIENAFHRQFTFKKDYSWAFSSLDELVSETAWNDATLMTFKEDLNVVKSSLNSMEPTAWRHHTTNTSISGRVVSHLQKRIQPELLTQAWCKFWEIINSYDIIKKEHFKNGVFSSVHLCEAPGAFVTSLNHYMKLNHPTVKWNWIATTLNPYYEGNSPGSAILDDRFIFHTLQNWIFGQSNVGDILDPGLVEDLKTTVDSQCIHFVTADGSIDCQDVPAEQEEVVAKLFLAETYAALCLLSQNGCFVCKMFTFFEAQTISLLYILNSCFRDVHVFKPATSKSGNSEVYVVCLGYIGNKPAGNIIACLKKHLNKEHLILKKDSIPKTFLNQIIDCARIFKDSQKETIQLNVDTFEGMSPNVESELKTLKQRCAEKFVKYYNVKEIDDVDKIAPNMSKEGETMMFYYSQKSTNLSYTDRQALKNSWKRKLGAFRALARDMFQSVVTCQEFNDTSTIMDLITGFTAGHVTMGNKVKQICSSLFCPVQLLTAWNELEEHASNLGLSLSCSSDKQWHDESFLDTFERKKLKLNLKLKHKVEISKHMVIFRSSTSKLKRDVVPDELNNAVWNQWKTETQKEYQKMLIGYCLNWLYRASPGDTVLIKLNSVHTRFTAGVLFFLASFFKSVSVFQPPQATPLDAHTWCFSDFSPNNNLYVVFDHFWRIFKRLQQSDDSEMVVLESLPLRMLCTHAFYKFLVDNNTCTLLNKVWFLTKKLQLYV